MVEVEGVVEVEAEAAEDSGHVKSRSQELSANCYGTRP